jgi:ankyrin repeat protein
MSNNTLINNKFFKNINLYSKYLESKDLNKRDSKGRNALFWAIFHKDYGLIKFLIAQGIDINVSNNLSAMNYAVYKDDVKLIKCLRNCGLDINVLDAVESTPLIYAVLFNKINSINYLVNNGACINHCDSLGNSALSLVSDLRIEYLISKFENISKSKD